MKRRVSFLKSHKLDTALLSMVLLVSVLFSAVNMFNYPQRFEDEGTYVSQAWAIVEKGQLTHYTYWYDHPPAGWIQIAGYFKLTNALGRHDSAVSAGREYMLVMHAVTIILLYLLARRLGIDSIAAAAGTALFGLSPLAVEFSRYALLDNVALPWLLAAFVWALSPKKNLSSAVLSSLAMVVAIMSKETFVVSLPVLLYALWTNSDARNRRFLMTSFLVVFALCSALYPLYAVLKNELWPGDGHVSLLGSLKWQLADRAGSGSLLQSGSSARGLVKYWLNIDFWLLLAGVVALPAGLAMKKVRIAAASLLIGLLMLLRSGYLPYPFVIMLLPFAALTFAGVLQLAIRNLQLKSFARLTLAQIFILGTAATLIFAVAADWQSKARVSTSLDHDFTSRQAIDWAEQSIPKNARIVVESAFWTDLRMRGFEQPVWLYKTETDPEVVSEIGGWQGIDYIMLNGPTVGTDSFASGFPTVSTALKNAEVVQEFGNDNQRVTVYRVVR